MAKISIDDLYRGERGGAKYGSGGVMGAVIVELATYGVPEGYDPATYVELLIMKHTLAAADKMRKEGDFVSGITDAEPPSCHEEV